MVDSHDGVVSAFQHFDHASEGTPSLGLTLQTDNHLVPVHGGLDGSGRHEDLLPTLIGRHEGISLSGQSDAANYPIDLVRQGISPPFDQTDSPALDRFL